MDNVKFFLLATITGNGLRFCVIFIERTVDGVDTIEILNNKPFSYSCEQKLDSTRLVGRDFYKIGQPSHELLSLCELTERNTGGVYC